MYSIIVQSERKRKLSGNEQENDRANEWGNETELRFHLVRNRSSAPFITVETKDSDFPLVFREASVAKGLETINRCVLVCAIFGVPVATAYCRTERRSFSSSFSFPLSSIFLLSLSPSLFPCRLCDQCDQRFPTATHFILFLLSTVHMFSVFSLLNP